MGLHATLPSMNKTHPSMQVVVNVGGPHAREEQQHFVREEVHGAEQHRPCVRQRLQHAVEGVEGQSRKRRQRVLLVILVVLVVQAPAHRE